MVPDGSAVAGIGDIEDVALATGQRERFQKPIAPLARPPVVREAGKTKILVSPFEEMFRAQVPDAHIVRPDLRDAGKRRHVVQIYQRDFEFGADLNQGRGGVPADDPVPFFIAKPRGVGCDPRLVVMKRGPQLMRPLVMGDAFEGGGAFLEAGQENEENLRSHSTKLGTDFSQVDGRISTDHLPLVILFRDELPIAGGSRPFSPA